MPKTSTLRVPSYRRHKPTGQAVATINGQDIYLGKWNTATSSNSRRVGCEWGVRWDAIARVARYAV
jgi:hypothetical protein